MRHARMTTVETEMYRRGCIPNKNNIWNFNVLAIRSDSYKVYWAPIFFSPSSSIAVPLTSTAFSPPSSPLLLPLLLFLLHHRPSSFLPPLLFSTIIALSSYHYCSGSARPSFQHLRNNRQQTPLPPMPPVRRPKRFSISSRHDPISHQSHQAAEPEIQMQVESMSWLDYVELGKTILGMDCSTQEQPGKCKLLQQHYKPLDKVGGIKAFNRNMIELGIDTSSLVIDGISLGEGGGNHTTVKPLNDFGSEMAERVNEMMIDIKARDDGAGSRMGTLSSRAYEFVMENKARFSTTCQIVMENRTLLSKACQLALNNKIPTWLTVLVVAAVGGICWQGRRPGERNVLSPGSSTEDDDDGDGDDIDGPETDTGDVGDNENGDKDGERLSYIMCRVTLDEPSDAHRAAKALPLWRWGHLRLCRRNFWSMGNEVYYRVALPLINEVGWFRADRVYFPNVETFNGYDLRKRVKG